MARKDVMPPPQAADAARILGQQIRIARIRRGWTAASLAARIGVSPTTIAAVEAGAPGTAIGTVFHAATMTGVPLFGTDDRAELARMRHSGEQILALIKQRAWSPIPDDDGSDF